ncbi:MAG: START-like domain-containing protein [Prevotellaceae bacterium]|nr:START-like domain-containing protein [Prevotellaceae bacterium]
MDKKKFSIEHELRCKSVKIIWPLLSTPAGLAKWLADEVTLEDGQLTFTWGNVWSHHEVRSAGIIEKKDFEFIRYRWCDEVNENAYWELKVEKGDITNDFILIITDFASASEKDTLEDIWSGNLERLHRSTGL